MRPRVSVRRSETGRRIAALVFLVAWFAGIAIASAPASAGEMEWKFRSQHPGPVSVELYSQDRNKTWPGGGQGFVLNDDKTRRFKIDCEQGERICFGAWARQGSTRYWGAGLDGLESCRSCCARCGSKGLGTQVLRP